MSSSAGPSAPLNQTPVPAGGYDFQPVRITGPGDRAVIPLVPARWGAFFTWDGSGPMPEDQR